MSRVVFGAEQTRKKVQRLSPSFPINSNNLHSNWASSKNTFSNLSRGYLNTVVGLSTRSVLCFISFQEGPVVKQVFGKGLHIDYGSVLVIVSGELSLYNMSAQ